MKTWFKITNGSDELLATGYVHSGVGVSFKLAVDEINRKSIEVAAKMLHEDGRLHSVTACNRLLLVTRIAPPSK